MGLLPLSIEGDATGISATRRVLTSYPSNRGESASLPQLQNEAVMHSLANPSLCIHLCFAGGEGTLGNRRERRAGTSALLPFPLEGTSPRVSLDKWASSLLEQRSHASAHPLSLRICSPTAFLQGQGKCYGVE